MAQFRSLGVGLIGMGVVGTGVVQLLQKNQKAFATTRGIDLDLDRKSVV